MPVGLSKPVQLRLLAVPKDGQRDKAHQVGDELGKRHQKRMPEVLLTVNRLPHRTMEIKDQERHRDSKNPVTDGGQTFDTLTSNLVIGSLTRALLRLVHALTEIISATSPAQTCIFQRIELVDPLTIRRTISCSAARANTSEPIWTLPQVGSCNLVNPSMRPSLVTSTSQFSKRKRSG